MASIYKRYKKDGAPRYVVRFRDPKGRRTERSAGSTKKAAENLKTRIERELADGTLFSDEVDEYTFAEFYEYWMVAKRKALKPSTVASYESTFSVHILPHFSNNFLSEIKPMEIQKWINEITAKNISPDTVRRIYRYLRSCLRQAVAWDVTDNDPCRGIILPRKNREELDFLKPKEIKQLIYAAGEPENTLFAILAMSGLRLGEALALAWRHIDLQNNIIIVERAYDYWGGLQDPKTDSSRRSVPMMPSLVETVSEYGLIQEELRPDDLLFSVDGNRPWDHSNVRKKFIKTLERAGLKRVTLHSLRHTFASAMLASGASIKALQRALGHASATMTLNTYSHLIQEHLGESLIRADILFSGKKENSFDENP